MKDYSKPAFPSNRYESLIMGDCSHQTQEVSYPGITIRDYFAAKVIQGLMSNAEIEKQLAIDNIDFFKGYNTMAKVAYTIADFMLIEREK